MSRPTEIELNEAIANNPLRIIAERCADVIERWGGKKIDVDQDGLRLISDYLLALGMELDFSVRPRNPKPPENFGIE